MEKASLQTSLNLGRSRVSRPYCRKRASHHSCVPSSVPFTVEGCTISHSLVFVTRLNRRATLTRALARVSTSASSDLLTFRFHTSSLHSLIGYLWSTVLNSSWPLSAAVIFPVMTQESVQFSVSFSVGSGRSILSCFNGRRVAPAPGSLLLLPGRGPA